MHTKRITSVLIWSLWSLFLAQPMADIRAQMENPPVQIATSNHPLTTAYNNGRRIVRDSFNGRYVVYQDLKGYLPIVCFCKSQDGTNWSDPDTLADGAFPSIAIDQLNRIYLVWQTVNRAAILFTYSEDFGTSWKLPPKIVSGADSGMTQYPVIEAGKRRVHIAWQQMVDWQPYQWIDEIFYNSLSLDSLESNFATPINISRSEADSKFPSIAHNLGFEEGNLYMVWYDSVGTDSLPMTLIRYRAVNEKLSIWEPPLSLPSYHLSENCGNDGVHPAISVGFDAFVYVVWGNLLQDRFHLLIFDPKNSGLFIPSEIQTNAEPFICIDDPVVPSVPIIWMNNNEIYYLLMVGHNPPVNIVSPPPLSPEDENKSLYPSVGYKQAQLTYFDVVWTDGNAPPYKLMYQRLQKTFSGVGQKIINTRIQQQFKLKQNYPNPFNASTMINYEIFQPSFITLEIYNPLGQKVRTLVNEWKQEGGYQARWEGTNDTGEMVVSGVYLYRLRAGDWTEAWKVVLLR